MFTRIFAAGVLLCSALSAGAQSSVSTNSVTNGAYDRAQLNGYVNAGSRRFTLSFQWGTTSTYGNTVAATPATVQQNASTNFNSLVTGLAQNTTYHYRAVATATDTTIVGQDVSFTTQSIGPPIVYNTGKVYGPGDQFAFFIADVNTNNSATTATFEYGLSTAYGQSGTPSPASLAAGTAGSFSCSISGLLRSEIYYYRWGFRNSLGTTYTATASFSTKPLAIGSVMGSEVRLYPNPASDHLYIDFPEGTTNPTIHVTDVMGRQVPVPAVVIGQRYQLDLSALSNGNYAVQVTVKDHSYSQIVTKN